MKPFFLVLMLVLAVVSVPAEGLYAPSVPEDAALVRVVNATPEELSVDIGPLRFRALAAYGASAYRPLRGDVFVLAHAGDRAVLTPQPKAFFSVILLPDGILVVPDERHTDPARSQLVVYNLTEEALDFVAVEPEATLAAGVAPGETALRVVNAIAVRVGAAAGDDLVYDELLDLVRGESYTLVVLGREAGPAGFVVQASVDSE
ncbi:MAG: alginate O-acetyltransferase AlgF [Spirochaetota bacterium]